MADVESRNVRYQSIHDIVLEAFPQTKLDHMSLPAGCERFQDGAKQVKGTGMYSDIIYSGFDVLRELGMRILHRLVQEIVRMKNLVERGRANVGVEAVYDALDELGVARTIDLADGDNLPPCPSSRTITRGRREGSQRLDGRQSLIGALHESYTRRAEEAAARAAPVGGDRGSERRMLIDVYNDDATPHWIVCFPRQVFQSAYPIRFHRHNRKRAGA